MRPDAVFRRDQAWYVRFSRIEINFRIPDRTGTYSDLVVHTSGDFMEGQKTVLGKVSGLSDEDSVYSVFTLKVLD